MADGAVPWVLRGRQRLIDLADEPFIAAASFEHSACSDIHVVGEARAWSRFETPALKTLMMLGWMDDSPSAPEPVELGPRPGSGSTSLPRDKPPESALTRRPPEGVYRAF